MCADYLTAYPWLSMAGVAPRVRGVLPGTNRLHAEARTSWTVDQGKSAV